MNLYDMLDCYDRAAIHEGTRYPCDQCEYVAKRPGDLAKHKKNIHVAEVLQCVLCQFSSKTPKVCITITFTTLYNV